MIQRIILGKCDFQSFMELGKAVFGKNFLSLPEFQPLRACWGWPRPSSRTSAPAQTATRSAATATGPTRRTSSWGRPTWRATSCSAWPTGDTSPTSRARPRTTASTSTFRRVSRTSNHYPHRKGSQFEAHSTVIRLKWKSDKLPSEYWIVCAFRVRR